MLRGLAALGVALFHFGYDCSGLTKGNFEPSLFLMYGRYGVDLFFMISGFVIFMTLERSSNVRNFAVSRFARLYPAFWTALLLTVLVIALGRGSAPGVATVAANATMLPALFGAPFVDDSYWTLAYELLFYALAAGFFLSGRRRPEIACTVWLMISVFAISCAPVWLMKAVAAPYSYLFVAGIMVYRLRGNGKSWASLVVLFTAIFISGRIGFVPDEHVSGLANSAMTVAFAAALWVGAQARLPQPFGHLLAYLGEISYPLYLVNQEIGHALLRAAASVGITPSLWIVVALLPLLGIAAAINAIVERPAQRWIKSHYLPRASNPRFNESSGEPEKFGNRSPV